RLDPGLVVLAIGPAPGEADAVALTPAKQAGVDEFAAIVTVPLAQGERQALGDGLDPAGDPLLVQAPDRLQVGPGGGHVDRDERGAILSRGGLPAMQDEVALQRARRHAGPLAPGAQRDPGPEGGEGRGEAPGLAWAAAAQRAQQPVEGR